MLSALRNFALTFVIAALIFGALAYVVVGFVLDTLTVTISADSPEDTIKLTYPEDTTAAPEMDPPVPVDDIEGETFNILLIGTDYQPELFDDYDYEERWTGEGFPAQRNRKITADMLVLLRVDKENRKFMFCSIPRNTRVMVDGNYMQLGEVLAKKNVEFLCGKVTGLTGMSIDYYASVNVGSVAAIIDEVGGVNYYVPEDMYYEDPSQNLVIDLKKGTNALDGAKAMQLLRYVGYENGNIGRMNTAIGFMQALLAKFTNITYLTKAPALYEAVIEHVETNFTADDLVNNLDLIFAYSKFEAVTVTYPGTNRAYDGVTYFEPSVSSAMDIFESYES